MATVGGFVFSGWQKQSSAPVYDGNYVSALRGSGAVNNFMIDNTTVINQDYVSISALNKGQSYLDPDTGASIKLITASGDGQQTTSLTNSYSRWSQENSAGTMYIAFGTNSTSCTVMDKETNLPLYYLAFDDSGNTTRTIGMSHEIRWDLTGNFPNRVYFINGLVFYMMDVTQNNNIDRSNPSRTVIRDFTSDIVFEAGDSTTGRKIYNDQEGNSSYDSDHWAWMSAYYDGSNYRVKSFMHYQISTDTLHQMLPNDTGVAIDAGQTQFYSRPNTIEMVPDGSAILIHSNRSYTGSQISYLDTVFDGPHIWPNDFNITVGSGGFLPKKVAVDSTHSGWGWSATGVPLFCSQDNRNDKLIYVQAVLDPNVLGYGTSAVPGAGVVDFADHAYMSYANIHMVAMPSAFKEWIIISTYGLANTWSGDMMIAMRLEARGVRNTTKCWRVVSPANAYQGAYFDESPTSISPDGLTLYMTGNAGDPANGQQMYLTELPSDWIAQVEAAI